MEINQISANQGQPSMPVGVCAVRVGFAAQSTCTYIMTSIKRQQTTNHCATAVCVFRSLDDIDMVESFWFSQSTNRRPTPCKLYVFLFLQQYRRAFYRRVGHGKQTYRRITSVCVSTRWHPMFVWSEVWVCNAALSTMHACNELCETAFYSHQRLTVI